MIEILELREFIIIILAGMCFAWIAAEVSS
jgi:hypothetical protein